MWVDHWTKAHDDIMHSALEDVYRLASTKVVPSADSCQTASLHWRMCKLDSRKVVPSADSCKTS